MLSYIERIENEYNNFYELMNNEDIYISDHSDKYKGYLEWMIEHDYIKLDPLGKIEFDNT